MLGQLRVLLAKHDMLSSFLIDSAEDMPAASAYRTRFGSLLRAYQLAGYRPDGDYRYLEINRALGDQCTFRIPAEAHSHRILWQGRNDQTFRGYAVEQRDWLAVAQVRFRNNSRNSSTEDDRPVAEYRDKRLGGV